MSINRAALKSSAKTLISRPKPAPISVGLVYLGISVLFSLLSTRLLGIKLSETDMNQIMSYIQSYNYEYAMLYLRDYMPPASSYIIDLALEVLSYILSAGFIIFLLNVIREREACYGNLLDGFGIFGRVILLEILSSIFIFLWSLLLVIPGIIAAYRYRMAIYILIDHPELSVMDCLRESKRMMSGHKWELFMLDLSFIGWTFLSSLTVVGWFVSIFTTPYFGLTYALYYEALCGHANFSMPDPYNNNTHNDASHWEG